MQVTLNSLVSHASFDWTCRGNKADLLKNLVVVVLQLIGFSEVDSSVSSNLGGLRRRSESLWES